jgi:Flp pilus assembly protein TadG
MSTSDTTQTTEPSRHGLRRRLRAGANRFWRDREGSTAIEFTALAIPFAMLVFAILESCISFAAQEVLTNATDDIARQLRTGQLRAAEVTETSLKKAICDRLDIVVAQGCPDLVVDLREFPTFAAAAAVKVKLTSDKDIDTTGFAVTPGKSMTKNMLRVFYKWPVITDFMRKAMSNLKDNKTLHFATVTWQNEPFDD